MSFNTLQFILFMALTVIVYYAVPGKVKNLFLLVASYVFYAYYSLPLTLFLVICTLVTYWFGIKIEDAGTEKSKKLLAWGIILNIGALAFYKYLNFAIGIFNGVLSSGGDEAFSTLKLLVPLGISFIVFTNVSYLIDVRKGEGIKAERNLLKFALYVSFFPKVVQGPITKAKDLLPQFDEEHRFDWDNFRIGALTALYGLFMKMVVADRLAVVVNLVYADPSAYTGAAALLATMMFSLQIYFDFAGYSLTAIGAARMLGFNMRDNFRQPYLSSSVGEFWRRWHMSLNKWLTDYIYIPLGGSKCSPFHRDVNTLVTFGISGLWHGADWGYVIWGLLNGAYIVVEKRIKGLFGIKKAEKAHKHSVIGTLVTFVLISFSWIFFRAQSLALSMSVVKRIFGHFDFSGFVTAVKEGFAAEEAAFLGFSPASWIMLAVILVAAFVIDVLLQKYDIARKVNESKRLWRWLVFYVLIFAIIIGGMYGYGYSAGAFIYAQF